ncbi:MAG: hypothetical protein KFW09_00730 [Oscillospiraceae bacterium]|nr:hypothetical protein [Oscillospiraceae bacterium]
MSKSMCYFQHKWKVNTNFKICYDLLSDINKYEGYGHVEEYGIKISQTIGGVSESLTINNISIDKNFVKDIILKLYNGQVTILTAIDIVEEILS